LRRAEDREPDPRGGGEKPGVTAGGTRMDIKLEGFAERFAHVTLDCRPVTPERPKRWRVALSGARDGSADVEGFGDTPISAVYDAAYRLARPR
jgi:hypothetical protein